MKQQVGTRLITIAMLTASLVWAGFAWTETGQTPDIAGIWLPVSELSQAWRPDDLPLTQAAREKLRAFNPQRHDSTRFCMPYGTPRNTLNTAPYPLEILQQENQITILFDRLGDIRRIFLDGRDHPQDPIPNWMGHSIGKWREDGQLWVETIAMTPESILTDAGLPHTNNLRLEESFALVEKNGENLLRYQLVLHDDHYYRQALRSSRYFRRSPHTEMGEGSGLCLLDQWRRQLEQINRRQFRQQQAE